MPTRNRETPCSGSGSFPMPRNILVTGASGFMGRALTTALKADGHRVFTITHSHGDITDPHIFADIGGERIDIVYHLAGRTDVSQSWERPGEYYRVNVMGTQNVLDFCRQQHARMIYLGTYVYGAPRYLPVDERHPVDPANPYTHSKWLGEELCRFYASRYNIPNICIRLFNVYGPGQKQCFLIPHLLKEFQRGDYIKVRSLAPRRDMLYIDDAINALRNLCQSEHTGIYNLGYGASWSVAEIVATLQELLGTTLPVHQQNELPPHEVMNIVADTRHIRRDFHWSPQYNLYDGLKILLMETSYGNQV